MLFNDIKIVFRRENVPNRPEKHQRIGMNSFYSNIGYGFEYKKELPMCIMKRKMKRKAIARKSCPYGMLVSFNKSVSYKINFQLDAGQLCPF